MNKEIKKILGVVGVIWIVTVAVFGCYFYELKSELEETKSQLTILNNGTVKIMSLVTEDEVNKIKEYRTAHPESVNGGQIYQSVIMGGEPPLHTYLGDPVAERITALYRAGFNSEEEAIKAGVLTRNDGNITLDLTKLQKNN